MFFQFQNENQNEIYIFRIEMGPILIHKCSILKRTKTFMNGYFDRNSQSLIFHSRGGYNENSKMQTNHLKKKKECMCLYG